MKKTIVVSILSVVLATSVLTGCGPEYCSVSGCPKESARACSYCYEHKCSNFSCTNKALSSYSYCRECIERAQ